MSDLLFFRGTQDFTLNLPLAPGRKEEFGFEACRKFQHLKELQGASEPAFTYCQAVAVWGAVGWVFRGVSFDSVLVCEGNLEWILCFPVTRRGVHYVPQTENIQPDGDNVFFFFEGTNFGYNFIRAVPDLDKLKFLSPHLGSRLGLIRAKNYHWGEGRNVVAIRLSDVLEMEIILDSKVHTLCTS